MNEEMKATIAAAVRMVAEVELNPIGQAMVHPALFAVAMGHVSELLKVVETLTMDNEALDAQSKCWEIMCGSRGSVMDDLNATVKRLQAENDRLSGMLAGELPF